VSRQRASGLSLCFRVLDRGFGGGSLQNVTRFPSRVTLHTERSVAHIDAMIVVSLWIERGTLRALWP
jgi:hypothetical protein